MTLIESYWKVFLWNKDGKKFKKIFYSVNKKKKNFNPYQNNSGTIISIANQNYCVVVSDTRYLNGFSIPTRFQTRIFKISEKIILASAGMFADAFFFQKKTKTSIKDYEYGIKKAISVESCAFYISSLLYSKRFFPYYVFNVLSGLDENDKGSVYSFDSVGSFEKLKFNCIGESCAAIQPLLDSYFEHQLKLKFNLRTKSIQDLINSIKEFFLKASKRKIDIGDGLQFFIINKKGIINENYLLRIE
ncbi:26S proteasome SU B6 (nucleomorph) [Cryptomonas paramecium]|uniref:26S proteasome SU B6 n=1 Tax=Cryptomonas paramaecium TaxID=2898 RepID=F2HHC1_9CRYP|nr:26S proteasome SU B6 [Cryptomonas paramecium]AEA38717.1 26S proteasome SU B6 [Cryptomonas paramecium]|mmetsp:Transcript_53480/g.141830  ORF Transcript_53480/g.141830 Transcript_53480/m.141830 type:complete len:246 (+) Transcript_53480:21483-22220(+)